MNDTTEDLTGFELPFGIVLQRGARHADGYWLWETQCNMCGRIRSLSAANIKRSTGKCPSCAQKTSKWPLAINGKRTPEYVAWSGMRERCGYIKGRGTYVDKGITVDPLWLGPNGFSNFMDHIGPKGSPDLVLDRIDNTGDYEPGNVRWATRSQSNSNKSDTHLVLMDGIEKPLAHWCQDYGIYPAAVTSRLVAGWTLEQAIKIPFRPTRPDIETYYLNLAADISVRSTCVRRAVGCILTDANGYVIGTGYNSVPKGIPHCTDKPCEGALAKSGEDLHKCMAIHAEEVALMKCDTSKVHTCYVTVSPCIYCARRLLNTSCQVIVFRDLYPHYEAKELWESQGRKWVHWSTI